jgi:short-subunit dehydrogenase
MLLDLKLSQLIMAVRSEEKGEAAAAELRAKHPKAEIEVWILDMVSYQSIQDFAIRCSSLSLIDIAILNAGLTRPDFIVTPHGQEEMLQVNFLSIMLLAIVLLPVLKAKASKRGTPSRMTVVNSGTAFFGAWRVNIYPCRNAMWQGK